MKRVRVGTTYRYDPVSWDIFRPANNGLQPNQPVRVVNLPGCPRAGTMGHCHVEAYNPETDQFEFKGLVLLASLKPWKPYLDRITGKGKLS